MIDDLMEFRRCFSILELSPDASLHDVRQAYKDLVNVWHPDRFAHNPRLREKAENKLKDINAAYDTITSQMHGRSADRGHRHATDPPPPGTRDKGARDKVAPENRTELAVELGAYAVLTVCYSLYKALHHVITDAVGNTGAEKGGKTT